MKSESSSSEANFEQLDRRLWQQVLLCPLCAKEVFKVVSIARDRHYGNPGTFPIVECESCGLWFLNPMPSIEFLSGAYPSDYYSYSANSAVDDNPQVIKRLKKLARHLIGFRSGWTGDPAFKEPGKVLDIGCGAGAFLSQMQSKGWDVRGVELSTAATERGRQRGLDIFGGTLEAAGYPDCSFDYIRSNHSFEHIHNPREVLREIRRIIKPDGLLFIGVPNVKGLMSRIFGTYWWYLGAPVHTFGYSPATLEQLLAQEGFRVIEVKYNSTFAGVFGSLQIFLNRGSGKGSEEGWLINNPGMQLLGHWIARWADIFHAGDCMEIIAKRLP